tara:strand:- start:3388 stop:3534 length:147 start_codon:yes stop_codon:yes gene_type:complete
MVNNDSKLAMLFALANIVKVGQMVKTYDQCVWKLDVRHPGTEKRTGIG